MGLYELHLIRTDLTLCRILLNVEFELQKALPWPLVAKYRATYGGGTGQHHSPLQRPRLRIAERAIRYSRPSRFPPDRQRWGSGLCIAAIATPRQKVAGDLVRGRRVR
jgi:hypothetical protein